MKTLTFLLVTALATSALAQDTPRVTSPDFGYVTLPDTGYVTVPDTPQVTVPDKPQATVPDTPRAAQLAPPAPRPPADRRPLPTRNVKVDVTIIDQGTTPAPIRKVISMVVADGRYSQVRSTTSASASSGANKNLPLYIDVTPTVTPDQKVFLELRLQYAGLHEVDDPAAASARVRRFAPDILETWNVVLTPGAPIMVTRAADAASDRTVTVEVKAEILK